MPSSMGDPALPEGVCLQSPLANGSKNIIDKNALDFVVDLQAVFGQMRSALLQKRRVRQDRYDSHEPPGFLSETRGIREARWRVAETPRDLQKRWGELWGPPETKALLEGSYSGADVYTVDLEDCMSPTWGNVQDAQLSLWHAVRGTLISGDNKGETVRLREKKAALVVRPRALDKEEPRVTWNRVPLAASFFDFGVFFYNSARQLVEKGSRPYFCLPKIETYLEARFWNEVFNRAQESVGLPPGTIRAVVPIETMGAGFEMEEILYELRGHCAGLVLEREGYLASVVRQSGGFFFGVFPEEKSMTMAAPFLNAYEELLVKTCHKRGAYAVGNLTRFAISDEEPEIAEMALGRTRNAKMREVSAGFDGSRAAQPQMVFLIRRIFEEGLGGAANQIQLSREKTAPIGKKLLKYVVPGGGVTREGVRKSVTVALRYLEHWLGGKGTVIVENSIQNAASAELAWALLWHWSRTPHAVTPEGDRVDADMIRGIVNEEARQINDAQADSALIDHAAKLLDTLLGSPAFPGTLVSCGFGHLDTTAKA